MCAEQERPRAPPSSHTSNEGIFKEKLPLVEIPYTTTTSRQDRKGGGGGQWTHHPRDMDIWHNKNRVSDKIGAQHHRQGERMNGWDGRGWRRGGGG